MRRKKQIEKCYENKVFSKEEIWNLDQVLAKIIRTGLKQFKNAKREGYPNQITSEEWDKILDKMYWTFNEIANDHASDPYEAYFEKLSSECPTMWQFQETELGHMIVDSDALTQWKAKHVAEKEQMLAEQKIYYDKIAEGKKLFIEYFEDLWD